MLKRYCLAILLLSFVSSFAFSHEPREGFDSPSWEVLAPMPDKGQPVDFMAPDVPYNVRGDAISTLVAKPVYLVVGSSGTDPGPADNNAALPFEVGWRSC